MGGVNADLRFGGPANEGSECRFKVWGVQRMEGVNADLRFVGPANEGGECRFKVSNHRPPPLHSGSCWRPTTFGGLFLVSDSDGGHYAVGDGDDCGGHSHDC